MFDSRENDRAIASKGSARMKSSSGPSETSVSGFETIEINAAMGGIDHVVILDSPGEDIVDYDAEANVVIASLASSPSTPYLITRNFEQVSMRAIRGGNDTLDLHDTALDDKLEVNEDDVRVYTDLDQSAEENYRLLAEAYYFERVNARSERGGINRKDEISDEQQRLFELIYYGDWEDSL
jgi:hypothetical protein